MHALERLEERVVLPMIKGGHKEFLSNRNNAEKALYSIVNIGGSTKFLLKICSGKTGMPEKGRDDVSEMRVEKWQLMQGT